MSDEAKRAAEKIVSKCGTLRSNGLVVDPEDIDGIIEAEYADLRAEVERLNVEHADYIERTVQMFAALRQRIAELEESLRQCRDVPFLNNRLDYVANIRQIIDAALKEPSRDA